MCGNPVGMADPNDPASRIRMGSPGAAQKVKVGIDSARGQAAIEDIERQRAEMLAGKQDPEELRRTLVRKYFQGLKEAGGPGRSSVRGHEWARIACHVGGVDIVIDWEFLPGPNGLPMLLAFCPECYWLASTTALTAHGTQPVFFEEQLARVPGNPESDLKFVPFQIQATSAHDIEMDNEGRVTVNRLVSCPQADRVCGWTVKITDSRASRQPRRRSPKKLIRSATGNQPNASAKIVKPGAAKKPSGPIITKAKS